jgi:hypothetical protein
MILNKMLGVAAELKVADHLTSGPRTAHELAERAEANPDALYRMLRALVASGIFAQEPDGRFANNEASVLLCTDSPQSLRDFILFWASEWNWAMWNQAGYSIKTGKTAAEVALGAPAYDYLRAHPDKLALFNRAMAAISGPTAALLPTCYDFSGVTRLCDVGGGTGTVLAEILVKNPHMKGVLQDLPAVVEAAPSILKEYGVQERCDLCGLNFFEGIAPGCDTYLLKSVIANWSDEESRRILARVRAVLPSDGRVLVVEPVIREDARYDPMKLMDLQMLVATHSGRERTEAEFRALFASADLQLRRSIPLDRFSILELTSV